MKFKLNNPFSYDAPLVVFIGAWLTVGYILAVVCSVLFAQAGALIFIYILVLFAFLRTIYYVLKGD